MYREHLRNTGQLAGEDDRGGLYWRYTLRDFFPKLGQENRWIPGRGPFQIRSPGMEHLWLLFGVDS